MILENRYNISSEQLTKMVRDGVIPPVVKNHYEIYEKIQAHRMDCSTCTWGEIFRAVASKTGENFENVKKIFYSVGKNL